MVIIFHWRVFFTCKHFAFAGVLHLQTLKLLVKNTNSGGKHYSCFAFAGVLHLQTLQLLVKNTNSGGKHYSCFAFAGVLHLQTLQLLVKNTNSGGNNILQVKNYNFFMYAAAISVSPFRLCRCSSPANITAVGEEHQQRRK